jgi:MFS family permease
VASVGDLVPPERTGSAIGLLGTVSAVGTALGPSLGGALIAALGWHAVFVFLAVTGLVALLAGYWLLPGDTSRQKTPLAFDLVGTALLVIALAAYALSTTVGPSSPTHVVIALAVVAALGVAVFVFAETRVTAPLVRPELLKDAGLSSALLALGLVSAIVMSTLVVGPFYLGEQLRLAPFAIGLVMTVGPAVAAIVGVPAGRIVDRFGVKGATIAGLIAVVAGAMLLAAMPGSWGVPGYIASLAVITAGYGLFQAANNTSIIGRVTPDQRGLVSGLLGLARNLGFITGASAMGAIFAAGARGVPSIGLLPGAETGMHLTFAASAALGLLGLLLSVWGAMPRRPVTL